LNQKLSIRNYDLSIDFRGDDSLRKLAYDLKIPFRVGHSDWKFNRPTSDYSFLLTHPVNYPPGLERSVERNIALLEVIGLHADKIIYDFEVDSQRLRSVKEALSIKNIPPKIAVIHAQSRDYLRGWVPEKFARVADYLVSNYGFHVLIIGAPVNSEYNAQILKEVNFADKIHNTAGWFTLEELPALLKLASIMVTIDSGPMHMAAAVGTPLVALMLPRFVKASYPYGKRQKVLVPDISDIISLLVDENNDGIMLNTFSVKKITDAIDSVLCGEQVE
jgi:ADP-heptose:LPS heptosyltransferase